MWRDIADWVSQISYQHCSQGDLSGAVTIKPDQVLIISQGENASRKRRRFNGTVEGAVQAPTPPRSPRDWEASPLPQWPVALRKRSRAEGNWDDGDENNDGPVNDTPRADASALSGSYMSASNSTRSRSSSPVKRQLMQLRLSRKVIMCQLTVDDPPNDASAYFLDRLDAIHRGCELLPHSQRSRILDNSLVAKTRPAGWKLAFSDPAEPENVLPGRIPSPEEVVDVIKRAIRCKVKDYEEFGWGLEVYWRLLELIFRQSNSLETVSSLDIMSCTTARPDPRWLLPGTQAKMVDYCVFTTLNDSLCLEAIKKLCHALRSLTVNHTAFTPLQFDPILLSIETKKSDTEAGKAQLQMAIWHSAQWAFLREAARATKRRLKLEQSAPNPVTIQEAEIEAEVTQALEELPFIPGLLISGHTWMVVLSTWDSEDSGKMKFWEQLRFGSTENIREVYQIVAGVRELSGWASSVYLPWFKRHLLNMPG